MSIRSLTTARTTLSTPSQRLTALGTHLRPQLRTMSSSTLPKEMRAVQITKTGGVDVLEHNTIPLPTLKENEVLVRNSHIGVNYIDTYFRTGLYPAPHTPYTLGREGEGTIVSAPASTPYNLKEGDRVVYLAEAAYAEYTAASAGKVAVIPKGIEEGVASAALLQGLTALTLIRETHPVQKGDWVLVHAAAGGVGLWLCQLLAAVGAKTIATASTEEKRELAKKAGAEVVVGYGEEEVKKVVDEKTGKKGVVAVFDGVGKATFDLSLSVLARKGTMASFGNASGAVPPLTIARLSAKNIKLARPTLFNYIFTREEYEPLVQELFGFISDGKIDVKIHEIYDLKDVARAHNDIEGRKTTGKLLLRP